MYKRQHGEGSEGGGISLDKAVALVATHLGVVDEEQINNMSYLFFEDILTELGHKLTYDAIVNYAGNSFCDKSWDMITKNNPFNTCLLYTSRCV